MVLRELIPKTSKIVKEDADADEVVRTVAATMLRRGNTLPPPLAEYAATVLTNGIPNHSPGKNKLINLVRDGHIACAVNIVKGYGFKPTRNAATKDASACSIVADALKDLGISSQHGKPMREANVVEIWRRSHFKIDPQPDV